MLVHKTTLGILDYIWDGQFRTVRNVKVPFYTKAELKTLGLNPEEWWVVNDTGLAKYIKQYYPFFDPITDNNGNLVSVSPWPKWKIYGEPDPKEKLKEEKPKKKRRSLRFSKKIEELF